MSAIALGALSSTASAAKDVYNNMSDKNKERLVLGATVLGETLPRLVFGVAGFILATIVTSILAVSLLTAEYSAQKKSSAFGKALLSGIAQGIAAGIVVGITNAVAIGMAFPVYIGVLALTFGAMGIMSILNLSLLHNIENDKGEKYRTSAFRYFSIAFWPTLTISMLMTSVLAVVGKVQINKFFTKVTTKVANSF